MARDIDIGLPIGSRLDREVAVSHLEHTEKMLDGKGVALQFPKVGEVMAVTIAKSGTTSPAVDLGANFTYLQVVVPTIDSAALELQAALDIGGTYQDLGQDATTTH